MRNNRRYYIAGLILLGLLGYYFLFSSSARYFYEPGEIIQVAAHRGSHSEYPENSLGAIQASIINGIDIVELDVRKTRDNELVILHDKELDRTTNGQGLLSDYSLDDLKYFNLTHKNKTSKEKIPSLKEVMEITRDKIIVNLDLKISDPETIKKIVEFIAEQDREESVILTIKDLEIIPQIHQMNPKIRIMPVVYTKRNIIKALKYDYIDIIQVYHRSYPEGFLKAIEDKDISIWVNALKKYDQKEREGKSGFEKLLKIKKVDVIQTDHPEELLELLRGKGLHP